MRWNLALGALLVGMVAVSGSGLALVEALGSVAATAQDTVNADSSFAASVATQVQEQVGAVDPTAGALLAGTGQTASGAFSDLAGGQPCSALPANDVLPMTTEAARAQCQVVASLGLNAGSFVASTGMAAAGLGESVASNAITTGNAVLFLETSFVGNGTVALDQAASCLVAYPGVQGALCAQADLDAFANSLVAL